MQGQDRKAAIAAYKERKAPAGIYAVRCAPSGQVWVGASPDLGAIENRLRFSLRIGSARRLSMQEAWDRHGAESFEITVIERLGDEDDRYIRAKRLEQQLSHWLAKLEAEAA